MDGLTIACIVGAEQLQFSGMLLAPPETVIVALAGQTISGMATAAVVDCPGGREPFGGEMLMPLTPLLDVLQGQSIWLFPLAVLVGGQFHKHWWSRGVSQDWPFLLLIGKNYMSTTH